MARKNYETESKYFSPSSGGSKRKAESMSSAPSTPLRSSTRAKKTIIPKAKLVESGSETDNDETDYKEESEAEIEEADDDSDSNQSVTIPLPKPRTAGDTPYEDDQIHPNTFLFLADLNKHNNRDWLKWHDRDFRTSQKDFETFVEKLTEVIMEKDPTVPELPKKDIIFRIYRDIRFSNDPTPYKPHFSAAWSRTGKKGPYAAYYLQIKPGKESFIGGGLWHPDGPSLERLREDIDEQPHRIRRALMNEDVRGTFFADAKGQERKVLQGFVLGNKEGALKTRPKGYDKEHKDIALLKLKNFTIGKKVRDEDVLGEGGLEFVAKVMEGLVPWVTYLNRTVMPDRNQADTEDEDQEDDNEDEGSNDE